MKVKTLCCILFVVCLGQSVVACLSQDTQTSKSDAEAKSTNPKQVKKPVTPVTVESEFITVKGTMKKVRKE